MCRRFGRASPTVRGPSMSSRRPKALVVTRTSPWPKRSGTTARLQAIVQALEADFDVDILAPIGRGSVDATPHSIAYMPLDHGADRQGWALALRWATRWRRPAATLRHVAPTGQVERLAAENGYQLVWIHRSELGVDIRPAIPGIATVVDADDDEFSRRAPGGSPTRRSGRLSSNQIRAWLRSRDAHRHAGLIRELTSTRHTVVVFSNPQSVSTARSRLESRSSARVGLVRNALPDPGYVSPDERDTDSGSMAFVGQMHYGPNADAVLELATTILPIVRIDHPQVRLRVIGSIPDRLRRLIELDGVEVTGRVDDLGDALLGVSAIVTPVRTGSGTSVKAVEALARGLPIISTEFGVRGLDMVNEEHYLRADTPTEFAQAWGRLSKNDMQKRLSCAGRKHYEDHFSIESMIRDVRDAIAGAELR